nr:Chain C, Seed lectin [Trichosanthes anguina]5Y42_F Chain F, Seed lectin [Trichosanthes anguina]5Y97_C Chain C, Seed lectin [Trichosanthes anguina]
NECLVETRTTRISGRDALCVDVAGALTSDGSRLILYPCGQQVNQKWTFHSDGTVRSLGKCLATNNSKFGNLVVIYDCSKLAAEDISWDVSVGGTIMNPNYEDLALTSNKATRSTNLTMEVNTYSASQGWRVGNYVQPIIGSIVGLDDMCLEATDGNTNMWLEECVPNQREQSWALYSDGTIRVDDNRELCVTASSSTYDNWKVITILNCDGSNNQRWVFLADGSISTPGNQRLAMDVARSDVDLKKIILHRPHGDLNQQWVLFY